MNFDISYLGLLPHLGAGELLLIAFIVLMLFGAKRLPEIAKGFGKAVREFRKSASELETDFRKSMDADEGAPSEKSAVDSSSVETKEVKGAAAEKSPVTSGTSV